jgi:hypothetical protein
MRLKNKASKSSLVSNIDRVFLKKISPSQLSLVLDSDSALALALAWASRRLDD